MRPARSRVASTLAPDHDRPGIMAAPARLALPSAQKRPFALSIAPLPTILETRAGPTSGVGTIVPHFWPAHPVSSTMLPASAPASTIAEVR